MSSKKKDVRAVNIHPDQWSTVPAEVVRQVQTARAMSVRQRAVPSNTITFSGKIVFNGPSGNATYGGYDWESRLENFLYQAIDSFLSRVSGTTSAEGIRVNREGFHVDLNVKHPFVVPSILTQLSVR